MKNTYTLTTITPTQYHITDQHGNIWIMDGNTRKTVSGLLLNLSRLSAPEQQDMLGKPTIKKKTKPKS